MQADCRHSLTCILSVTLTLVLVSFGSGCSRTRSVASTVVEPADLPWIVISDSLPDGSPASDTLTAVTLNGPMSFFIFKGENMGYDYTLLREFGADSRQAVKLYIAPNLPSAINAVRSGTADILAYDVPITSHYRRDLLPCGTERYSTQVLVQPKVKGKPTITDVTELIGREVYVIDDSKYHRRLENLNEELADEIIIRPVNPDSATVEDLVAMVSEGEIPFAVVDSDIARLNKTYFSDVDVSLEVSTPQRASWAVAKDNTGLAERVSRWFATDRQTNLNVDLLKRYFEMSKSAPDIKFDFSKGRISAFDGLFKQYARNIDWDWRLLAAQAYVESLFNPEASSWMGARGLMQVVPSTGEAYGASPDELLDPSVNVRVATDFIADLNRYLINRVPNDRERIKFILAAYNCGIGHIFDAIELAKRHDLDPQKWDNNVEKALLMKMNPNHFNDSDVKYGYSRGSETVTYVRRVRDFYRNAVREIPL